MVQLIHDKQALEDFAAAFGYCWLCGSNGHGFRKQLTIHHIIQAYGRSDERCNFAMLCQECHDLYHSGSFSGPKVTLGMILTLKRWHDPEHWDYARLCELKERRCLPEPEPIPEVFLEQFKRRQPAIWERIVNERIEGLTKRQAEVTRLLLRHRVTHRSWPTMRQIGEALKSTVNSVFGHFTALERHGIIQRDGKHRSMSIVDLAPCPCCKGHGLDPDEVKQLEAQLSQRIESSPL